MIEECDTDEMTIRVRIVCGQSGGRFNQYDTLPVETGRCSTCGCEPGTSGYGDDCSVAPQSCPTRGDYYTGKKNY